ncbi:alanine racemase [Actinomyces sp. B33]|uniref:alanine racemase n=1 Tax=Actinomyces sp. B33 TaxID=2942131 RepID=UPI002341514E|nr:alanine racemase [Actinomyces sp. B33]MDC4233616.1 alanine racemase [Actinomyces sp. B33]
MTERPDAARPDDALRSDYPARAVVDLGAIGANLRVLRAAAPTSSQMAVVKADAYGHGLGPVSLAALRAGADWLGVAQVAEALDLRALLDAAGIPRSLPVLAWIGARGFDWGRALDADIDLSVSWTWTLAEICAAARDRGRPARIHVKIDTGMSRAGSTLADLPALAAAIRTACDEGLVDVVGAWSHLSRADDPSDEGLASTAAHIEAFERGLAVLADAGVRPRIRHLAATSGILWHPDSHYDLVRAGIGLYGLSPAPSVASSADLGLTPAMTLEAPLTSVKAVDEDVPASYGGTWRSPTRRWLGLVPLGYADGILRASSNGAPVLVRTPDGDRAGRVVGRVCMDQVIVDLGPADGAPGAPSARTPRPPARVGDRAVLFGDPASGAPSADDWAACADTINYEIVSRLGERIPRVHLPENRGGTRCQPPTT